MPSILHCYADWKWTGPSEPVALLCDELSRRGWHSELACMRAPAERPDSLPVRARTLGLTVHDGFHFAGGLHWRRHLRDLRGLRRLIANGGFDLVHAHGSWDHVLAALAVRRAPGHLPLVRTDHGARELRGGLLERAQLGPRRTDHLIVLSDRLRARAVERLGRAPHTVSAVRGAVDCEQFRPEPAPEGMRRSLGLGPDDVAFALVARVQPHRRFGVLLAAADIARRRDERIRIMVLGRGTRKERLLDRPVRRMGLEHTVLALGYRRDDYRQVLAAADAGLMLVAGSDGSCRAALQLAAMGKPLVVARRGVMPDIVTDGETGIVVQDTAEGLADALVEMAAVSAGQRRAWGLAGRARMQELFSPSRQAEDVAAVYQRVLAGRQ